MKLVVYVKMVKMIRRGIKRRIKVLLLQLARSIVRRPRLKKAVRHVLRYFPGLKARLGIMYHSAVVLQMKPYKPQQRASGMALRTARMYRELKKSLNASKN